MTKTVFTTGSSSGFGQATVATFHAAGWNVVATMLERSVEDFRNTWDQDDDRLLVLPLDVTDSGAIESALDAAANHFGGIDVVVNVAGFGMLHPFEATTEHDIQLLFDTNCFGPMSLMRQAIPYLRSRGGGSIVNLTSGSAVVPEPLMSVYNPWPAPMTSRRSSSRRRPTTRVGCATWSAVTKLSGSQAALHLRARVRRVGVVAVRAGTRRPDRGSECRCGQPGGLPDAGHRVDRDGRWSPRRVRLAG